MLQLLFCVAERQELRLSLPGIEPDPRREFSWPRGFSRLPRTPECLAVLSTNAYTSSSFFRSCVRNALRGWRRGPLVERGNHSPVVFDFWFWDSTISDARRL